MEVDEGVEGRLQVEGDEGEMEFGGASKALPTRRSLGGIAPPPSNLLENTNTIRARASRKKGELKSRGVTLIFLAQKGR